MLTILLSAYGNVMGANRHYRVGERSRPKLLRRGL